MPAHPVIVRPFDFANATDSEYVALNRHMNRSRAEALPDDPPTPLEETIVQMKNVPPFVSVTSWAGWEGAEMVASAVVSFMRTPENAHLAQLDVSVEPPYRRQGIGRELLRCAIEVPVREGRRLVMTDTNERIPAGEAFMVRLGAERGLQMHTNQLNLAEVDRTLLARWQTDAEQRAANFTLGFWDGAYPDDQIEAIAALMDVMNTAPRDGLDMEDIRITPEFIRQGEKSMLASGRQRWTLYARETTTDRLAGFTDVYWNPHRPQIISQGMTGVWPEFRGRGIGRWIKATMLDRIRRTRPEALFVRTGNADSNAAMLSINRDLGFQPYMSHCVWQIDTEKVLEYLNET